MRIKFNKEIEFYLKKIFFSQKYLLKRRLERSIKNNEENELKLVKDFILPGTDSIDIGVYRGVYSFQMSKFSKTVHAFKPNPIIYEDLQKNLLKITKNIEIYNSALSNNNKIVTLKVPIRNPNFSEKNYEEYFNHLIYNYNPDVVIFSGEYENLAKILKTNNNSMLIWKSSKISFKEIVIKLFYGNIQWPIGFVFRGEKFS